MKARLKYNWNLKYEEAPGKRNKNLKYKSFELNLNWNKLNKINMKTLNLIENQSARSNAISLFTPISC